MAPEETDGKIPRNEIRKALRFPSLTTAGTYLCRIGCHPTGLYREVFAVSPIVDARIRWRARHHLVNIPDHRHHEILVSSGGIRECQGTAIAPFEKGQAPSRYIAN